MTATLLQARDEILGALKTAWDADPGSTGLPVLYSDTEEDVPATGAWARVTVQHNEGFQATLSNAVGARRFRRLGTVTVQVFTPHNEGGTLSDTLATVAKNAFEGVTTSPGRVIFRNVRVNEVGQDKEWFQVNVLADFEYDEIR